MYNRTFIPFCFIHPAQVCMSYYQHFCFSMYLARRFAMGSVKAIIHAFLPDYFITSSSDLIEDIRQDMSKIGCRPDENNNVTSESVIVIDRSDV
jgi:hypothetical protein